MRKVIGIINMVVGVLLILIGVVFTGYMIYKGLKVGSYEITVIRLILYFLLYVGLGIFLYVIGNNFRKNGGKHGPLG